MSRFKRTDHGLYRVHEDGSLTPVLPFAPMEFVCIGCHLHPGEIEEYIDGAEAEGLSPDEYLSKNEGTLNPDNGHFACTECFIKMGMPASPFGWIAP